jgi:hypothetical protein
MSPVRSSDRAIRAARGAVSTFSAFAVRLLELVVASGVADFHELDFV